MNELNIISTVAAVISSVTSGLIVALFKRMQDKRDRLEEKRNHEVDARAAARKEESYLALNLQMANAKLAYATAVAVKSGHPNGEIEEGIAAYTDARQKYLDFINRQATAHLS